MLSSSRIAVFIICIFLILLTGFYQYTVQKIPLPIESLKQTLKEQNSYVKFERIVNSETGYWEPEILYPPYFDMDKNRVTFKNGHYYHLANDFDFREIETINSNRSLSEYKIPKIYKFNESLFNCQIRNSKARSQLFLIMKGWLRFVRKTLIIWWLWYGSLLSSVREKDMNPWDTDMDILIPSNFEDYLRSNSTKTLANEFGLRLVTRPAKHCGNIALNSSRRDCKGNIVNEMIDSCSFCGPLARIMLNDSSDHGHYIDVYKSAFYLGEEGRILIYDEGTTEDVPDIAQPSYKLESIFPIKLCELMNLYLPCPNKPPDEIQRNYGAYFMNPYYICDSKTKKWIKYNA